jgi:hypothetical protein
LIKALTQLRLAEAEGPLPAGHVMDRLTDISWRLVSVSELLKLLKILSESIWNHLHLAENYLTIAPALENQLPR